MFFCFATETLFLIKEGYVDKASLHKVEGRQRGLADRLHVNIII